MKRLYLLSAVVVSVLGACADTTTEPTLVKRQLSQVEQPARHIIDFNGNSAPRGFSEKVAQLGGAIEFVHPAGLGVVTGLTAEGVTAISGLTGVRAVMEDVVLDVAPVALASDELDMSMLADAAPQSQANPATALRYSFQWNMRQIGANTAWLAGKLGDKSISVAILDTGIDYGNRDLAGLVDLTRSKSFVPMDTDTLVRYFGASWHPVTDLQGHGTNVAAQVSSLAFATAGIGSKTTLIGVKVLNQNGSGSLSAILAGLLHAADVDADVANMSLGVKNGSSKIADGRYVATVNKAFNYAHRMGMLVVVSAGNDAADMDHDGNTFRSYCSAPNVICVAATGPTGFTGDPNSGPKVDADAPAVYSNFGRSAIDLSAPGGNTGGFVWSFCARHAIYPFYQNADNKGPRFPCTGGGNLIGMAGTSQASPHVAGLAALIAVNVGRNNPSAIKDVLLNTADDLGTAGTDPFYGKGRINVARALGL
jgi:lantibiotic leader peptide-processing serine protease